MSSNATAAGVGALDGAAPALGVAVLGGKFGDLLVVHEDSLGVVAGRVVVLVCHFCQICVHGLWVWRIVGEVLTVHGDAVSNSSISAFSLNGHLRSGYFSHW